MSQVTESSSPDAIGAVRPQAAPGARDPRLTRGLLSLDDFERRARRHLPRSLFGFIAGGAETEAGVAANRESFAAQALVPRVLRDTSSRSQLTTLWGHAYAAPFGVAPMGVMGLAGYRADEVLARACAGMNVPMVLSAASLIPMEEVRQAGTRWYQAYLPGDPDRIDALVDRVAGAGFEVFVLTADVPVPANRENNVRNNFTVPIRPGPSLIWDALTHPGWLFGTGLRTLRSQGIPHFENMDAKRGPPVLTRDLISVVGRRDRLTWEHVARIRRRWKGPLVLKGLLSPADAALARDAGIDGIIVSNHGGRQLDGAASPLRMLPRVKEAAGPTIVMLDGGLRRGTDVLKALALGAQFVFVGRPFAYAAALGGEELARHAVRLLMEEIDRDMALMGLTDLSGLGPDDLVSGRSASCRGGQDG